MRALFIISVATAVGCAGTTSSQHPEPAVRFQTWDTTAPLADYDAASYYGVVIGGERLGEVAVWSNGAFVIEENGERIPILELTILARNESQTPFSLDLGGTGVNLLEATTASIPEEYAVAGTRTIAPGETRRLGLRYRLPSEASMQDLGRFDFVWAMRGARSGFAQRTPFRFLAPGQFELGAEWPQTRRVSYVNDNRRPWSIRWSAVTPEPGDAQVYPGDEMPPFRWQPAPAAKAEDAPTG